MPNQDELIAQYSDITGANVAEARQILEAFDWNVEAAMEDHYANGNETDPEPELEPDYTEDPDTTPQKNTQNTGGGYRLGAGPSTSHPVPPASAPSQPSSKPKQPASTAKRFATLGDFSSNAREDSDTDDDNQDMYAGGDKSGLAIQNPGRNGAEDLKKKIIEKARKGGREIAEEEPKKRSHFTGNAFTLGGEDAPSQEIKADPTDEPAERVKRNLHFWEDGFSIDDGDLFRFDDPANAAVLSQIRSGRAPLHIMNVGAGQEVDVQVVPHQEKYVKPKKQYRAFEGQGQRLGSPTPGTSSSTSSTMPGAFTQDAPTVSTTTSQPPASQVDESKPIVTLRISLGTGTRLTARFNTDQTIGDVYGFARSAEASGRNFVLQTTFPTKEFTDHAQVLGDIAELKRGGALVQKYT